MNLKMRKSLAIKEGILRFMGRIAAARQAAQAGVAGYQAHWARLEELSQINLELLRRGEPLAPSAP